MHELSLAMNMIQMIEEQRAVHGFEKVEKVHVSIGEFSSVVPEALEFSFSIASKGTSAEGAALIIRRVPLIMKCNSCSSEFQTEPYLFLCPDCGGTDLQMLSGNELQIESIEV